MKKYLFWFVVLFFVYWGLNLLKLGLRAPSWPVLAILYLFVAGIYTGSFYAIKLFIGDSIKNNNTINKVISVIVLAEVLVLCTDKITDPTVLFLITILFPILTDIVMVIGTAIIGLIDTKGE